MTGERASIAAAVDLDGHVLEPADIWSALPARFDAYRPHRINYAEGSRVAVGRQVGNLNGGFSNIDPATDKEVPAERPGGSEPGPRLLDMDIDGIESAVLFTSIGLYIHAMAEREPQAAMCRVINDWLAGYCAYNPERLRGVGILPGNPEDAVVEAKRCVALGLSGVWRRPDMYRGLPALHSPAYEPLWSFLADAGVPFFVHAGYNGIAQPFFTDRFADNILTGHAAYHPAEQMMAMTSIVCYGILERHPKLRVGFMETGGLWALYFLHRLDEHLEKEHFRKGLEIPLSLNASQYFRRQCIVTVEDAEPGLTALLEHFPENVAFASDYPHADATFPGSTRSLLQSAALTEVQRRAVLSENARRFMSLGD